MKRPLWIFFGLALLFTGILYFGFETSSMEQKELEESRAANIKAADVNLLERNAKKELGGEERAALESIAFQLEQAASDSVRVELLKSLSGYWYRAGEPAIAGHYAEQVAEIEQTENAWSIAGTTYAYGIGGYEVENVRQFSAQKSREAFEKAISLKPEEVTPRINLAVTYAEYPPPDNPMKGIQMLLELADKYPDHPGVLLQLARFGIQTGQYEKAAGRLERVLEIEPDNMRAICLIAQAYEGMGAMQKAADYREMCEN